MKTIFWILFCSIVIIEAYLYAFVWFVTHIVAKWMKKNGELMDEEFTKLDTNNTHVTTNT